MDVRIIAATNRDIAREVKEGRFRKDLFYRLNVFPIVIPPLREHPEDIPLMVWAFVREFQKGMGKEIESIPRKSIDALQSYPWPGNVRELKNVIERAMIVSSGKTLIVHVPGLASLEAEDTPKLEDTERRHIVNVLERTGWRVAGKGGAAEILGLNRSTLLSKMKKLGIKRPAYQEVPGTMPRQRSRHFLINTNLRRGYRAKLRGSVGFLTLSSILDQSFTLLFDCMLECGIIEGGNPPQSNRNPRYSLIS